MTSSFDIEARQAEILGPPPRIAPLEQDAIAPEVSAMVAQIMAAIGREPPKQLSVHTSIVLRHPELYRRHTELALMLYRGALTARQRELAVLRLSWISGAPFEWGEHVENGRRIAGLTGDEIARIKEGAEAPDWNEEDRAILQAVEELLVHAMITDATWAVLARFLNDQQLIELPVLVGQYLGVAYLQNSLRSPLLAGNRGLLAE